MAAFYTTGFTVSMDGVTDSGIYFINHDKDELMTAATMDNGISYNPTTNRVNKAQDVEISNIQILEYEEVDVNQVDYNKEKGVVRIYIDFENRRSNIVSVSDDFVSLVYADQNNVPYETVKDEKIIFSFSDGRPDQTLQYLQFRQVTELEAGGYYGVCWTPGSTKKPDAYSSVFEVWAQWGSQPTQYAGNGYFPADVYNIYKLGGYGANTTIVYDGIH